MSKRSLKKKVDIHPWNLKRSQAIELQQRLSRNVIISNTLKHPKRAGGVDVSFSKKDNSGKAAVVVLNLFDLKLIESAVAVGKISFPYIPGLLSFREVPLILESLQKLEQIPDVILCDGQGIAHPRRLGLASHLGVLLDIPTIGVAKSRLIGEFDVLPRHKGAWVKLMDRNECIGAVLRTRDDVKPLFISIGHKISLERAVEIVLNCVIKYRLPETTRLAHKLAAF